MKVRHAEFERVFEKVITGALLDEPRVLGFPGEGFACVMSLVTCEAKSRSWVRDV